MLKKIDDPELIWKLWQAALVLNELGTPRADYERWHEYTGYESASGYALLHYCNRAYIELEY